MDSEKMLLWLEQEERNSFRVKKSYVDAAGDLVAGVLLGQIVFWHLPNKQGASKLRVIKDGKKWLAKGREDWYEEIRITPKQFDRAIKILKERGFVTTKLFKFNGAPMVHIQLDFDNLVTSILPDGENGFLPLGKMEIDERVKSLTEITTEITTKNKTQKKNVVQQVEPITLSEGKKKEPTMEEFLEVWNLYPNKKGRAKAFAAYKKALKNGTTKEEIVDGLNKYKRHLAEVETWRSPADGSTWFNQERWTDEYETPNEYVPNIELPKREESAQEETKEWNFEIMN